ncbi:hypothetical protein EON67_08740 [archaeon]|nr:MAG: hypothetical protein EON67_08740 [archaeon]
MAIVAPARPTVAPPPTRVAPPARVAAAPPPPPPPPPPAEDMLVKSTAYLRCRSTSNAQVPNINSRL